MNDYAHSTAPNRRFPDLVTQRLLKAAGAWLLQWRIGEVFDAIVTGAAAKGNFVRICSPLLEGRVVRGFEGLDVGDAVRFRLVAVDAEKASSTLNAFEFRLCFVGQNAGPSEQALAAGTIDAIWTKWTKHGPPGPVTKELKC